ncbi:hypothetical protein GCM10025780_35530 [Frondihabitans cladoniiphilus]|uniref:DUF1294 domain-containing protein n=1 Tax=Frondihabitans cladoniiphilus TaxID=715785 RepID=A0ABP8WBS4_9MICO
MPLLSIPLFAALFVWRAAQLAFPAGVPWIYAVLSVLLFVVYGVDKSAARNGRWRVSERNLLVVGLLGGWPGAVIAQQVFRHKTRKRSFQGWFWATVVVNAAVVLVLVRA